MITKKPVIENTTLEASKLAEDINALVKTYQGKVCLADMLGALESVKAAIVIELTLESVAGLSGLEFHKRSTPTRMYG